jgi:hypothetical protein
MGRGAAGVPTGSVSNARRCQRARCRVNGRPARRLAGRQHGPGDDDPAQARALAREDLIAAFSPTVSKIAATLGRRNGSWRAPRPPSSLQCKAQTTGAFFPESHFPQITGIVVGVFLYFMERDRRRLPRCSRHILRRQRENEGSGIGRPEP